MTEAQPINKIAAEIQSGRIVISAGSTDRIINSPEDLQRAGIQMHPDYVRKVFGTTETTGRQFNINGSIKF